MISQVYSGAKATISINGSIVAAAFVADYSIDTRASEIETIDSVFPLELAPERIRVSLNLRVYRSPDNDPVKDKIAPGRADMGQSAQFGFTQANYLSIEIKDNNDQTIVYMPKAWLVRRSGGMSSGDFLVETWQIISLGYMGPTS